MSTLQTFRRVNLDFSSELILVFLFSLLGIENIEFGILNLGSLEKLQIGFSLFIYKSILKAFILFQGNTWI